MLVVTVPIIEVVVIMLVGLSSSLLLLSAVVVLVTLVGLVMALVVPIMTVLGNHVARSIDGGRSFESMVEP